MARHGQGAVGGAAERGSPSGQLPGRLPELGGRPARPRRLLLRGRPPRPDPDYDPALLAGRTLETAESLLAVGLDPAVCTLFVQSHVPEHPRLTWLLECTATFGELRRMTQFKDKGGEQETVRVGLFTYPVLMAADILLYDADRVPVGEDQRQHLELTRDVAIRFNHRYGETFVVPEAAVPKVAARVMDLQEPTRKMSKSVSSPLGTVLVLDPPEEIDRKVRKAVTDTETEVRYDPAGQARACRTSSSCWRRRRAATPPSSPPGTPTTDSSRRTWPRRWSSCCARCASAYAELQADRGYVESVLAEGAAKAGIAGGARPSTGPCGPPGCSPPRAASAPDARVSITALA